jgi:hypothetical protein
MLDMNCHVDETLYRSTDRLWFMAMVPVLPVLAAVVINYKE